MQDYYLRMQEAIWRSQYLREEIKNNNQFIYAQKHKDLHKFYLQYLREVVVNADKYLDSLKDQRTKKAFEAIKIIQDHLFIINQVINLQ